ncbi:MAG: ankyrin repeat domain-containing protein [Chloroflexota bacterium]
MSEAITPTLFDDAVDAVINGDLEQLQHLLQTHPALATAHSHATHQATLLHYVSANGIEADKQKTPPNIVSVAKILLEAGANPNQMSNIYGGGIGSTPLVGLVSSSHPADAGVMYELVMLFCEFGPPNGIANDSLPLRTAISFRQRDAIRALADSGARTDHLVTASATGNLEQVKALYSETPAPYHDSFGQTWTTAKTIHEHALTIGAMVGHLDVVQFWVEQGVDIDAKASSSGDSTLLEAIMGGYDEVVQYLLEQGADASEVTYPTGNDTLDKILRPYVEK